MYDARGNAEERCALVRWRVVAQALLMMAVSAASGAAHAQPAVYVVNVGSDDVSVIDPETNAAVATVPVGRQPNGIAVTPDGRRVYVSNLQNDTVSVLDAATRSVVGQIGVGDEPVGVAVSPDGRRVYVANRGSDSVTVIDAATGAVAATVADGVGPGSNGIALTPDGAYAYVNNAFSRQPGTVSVLDTVSGEVVASVEVAANPKRVAIAPDGRTAYVANFRSWNISVVDVASNVLESALRVSGRTVGVAVHPNGQYAYVTNLDGTVEILETGNNLLTVPIAVGREPYAIALSGQGGTAYVANLADDTVSVVDLGSDVAVASIPVGDKPFAVAWGCMGEGCDQPPFTAKPTRTVTPTPTITLTPTITETQPATETPTPNPGAVLLQVAATAGRPNEVVDMTVSLDARGRLISGVEIDIGFDPRAAIVRRSDGRPDCAADPATGKDVFGGFQPSGCSGGDCTAARLIFLSFANTAPLPDRAALFACRLQIAGDASPGEYALRVTNVGASSPDGIAEDAIGISGTVTVFASEAAARLRAAGTATGGTMRCAIGADEGAACADDRDCEDGVCTVAVDVCDGGADDGLLCDCPGGACEGPGSCASGGSLGVCRGGRADGACCDPDFRCSGGSPCLPTARICAGGVAKGLPCLRDEHCRQSTCVSTGQVCAGEAFDRFACVNEFDCPGGTCLAAPTPRPLVPSGSGSNGGGCAIGASERGAGAWVWVLSLVLLGARPRRRTGRPGRLSIFDQPQFGSPTSSSKQHPQGWIPCRIPAD